jgi:oxalate decarboxylase/phosphoglucose isomerase-like protein (cupin superfamily)
MSSTQGYSILETDLKADARGQLAELVRDVPGGAQIYAFTINPGQRRGGHWHERKHEWFVCVRGEALLLLETNAGPRTELRLPGDFSRVVHVEPGTRHTFSSVDGAMIVACISESFDPSDPDTFFPPPDEARPG